MSDTSYTYTTITAGRQDPVRIAVSFYLDEHSWIRVCGAAENRPILTVAHGDVSVTIAPRTAGLTPADAAIARSLADQAARYATEVERLCHAAEADRAKAA